MKDSDEFEGVDPARLALVKRRIAVLREYLEIAKPSGSDAQAAARKMGVGINLFYTLLRVWKRTRRPVDLPGAQVPGGRRTGYAHLEPAAEAVLVKAIEENRGKPLREITREIRAAFRVAGIGAPSGVTIARRAQQAMSEKGYWPKFSAGAVLVLLAFQIDAVTAGDAMPWILMARHALDSRLLAWNLSLEFPNSDACRDTMVSALRSLTSDERSLIGVEGPPTIVIASPIKLDQTEVGRTVTFSGWTMAVSDDASIDLARGIFGRRVAELALRPWHPGSPARPWKHTPRLGVDELRERLGLALGVRGAPSSSVAFDPAFYLAERLAAISARP